jgi:predicted RNA polymerase sigma factor
VQSPAPTRCRPGSPRTTRARTATQNDWPHIAALYDVLAAFTRSPIVELNRGVAHGMAFGASAGVGARL